MKPPPEHATPPNPSVAQQLWRQGSCFDFFQATSLLERIHGETPPSKVQPGPAVRFRSHPDTAFPASDVQEIQPPQGDQPAEMTVNFMGLTGPAGALPSHYTELVTDLECAPRSPERHAFRDWLDVFNNRLIHLFYKAWTKARIELGVARGQAELLEPDTFSAALYSLVGMGLPRLRNRLRAECPPTQEADQPLVVDRVRDWGLLRHAGALTRRGRSAHEIERLLSDYFAVSIHIESFRGHWLPLGPNGRTQLVSEADATRGVGNQRLGSTAVLGTRAWNVESRVRVRVGPLTEEAFARFLPDAEAGTSRRPFLMLCQLVRFLLGPELDYDVQLVLQQNSAGPRCVTWKSPAGSEPASTSPPGQPARLGWNTWTLGQGATGDLEDAVFAPLEQVVLS